LGLEGGRNFDCQVKNLFAAQTELTFKRLP